MQELTSRKGAILAVLVVVTLGLVSCAVTRERTPATCVYSGKPVPLAAFCASPFGHDETVAAFGERLKGKQPVKMAYKNKHDPTLVDTIYEYKLARGGKVMLYQTSFGQQFFLGAIIADPGFVLHNGLRVGMRESEVRERIGGLPDLDRVHEVRYEDAMRTLKLKFSRKGVLERIELYGQVD